MSGNCCVALLLSAMSLSAVCDCDISLSYSLTIIEHENITQIEVIYVSVQPLHNRRFVTPHKSVELMAWTSER